MHKYVKTSIWSVLHKQSMSPTDTPNVALYAKYRFREISLKYLFFYKDELIRKLEK